MEIIIIIAVAVVAVLLWSGYVKTKKTEADQTIDNWQPPKVEEVVAEVVAEVKAEVAVVKEVAKKTTSRVKKALDVNEDGKVDLKDAVAGVKAVKAKVAAKTTKAKPKA
jgi:uncharacterized protein (UPF0333 family)